MSRQDLAGFAQAIAIYQPDAANVLAFIWAFEVVARQKGIVWC